MCLTLFMYTVIAAFYLFLPNSIFFYFLYHFILQYKSIAKISFSDVLGVNFDLICFNIMFW